MTLNIFYTPPVGCFVKFFPVFFTRVDKLISFFFAGAISYTEYLFLLCILTSEYLSLFAALEQNLENMQMMSCYSFIYSFFHISEPHAGFRIAFNMFDADGNEMVDKREFMVVWVLITLQSVKINTH